MVPLFCFYCEHLRPRRHSSALLYKAIVAKHRSIVFGNERNLGLRSTCGTGNFGIRLVLAALVLLFLAAVSAALRCGKTFIRIKSLFGGGKRKVSSAVRTSKLLILKIRHVMSELRIEIYTVFVYLNSLIH